MIQNILKKQEDLDNIYPISSEYVEEDSILREFIGGSIFKGEKEI